MDNYNDVLMQIAQFGIQLKPKDFPLPKQLGKRITCGDKGKDWYWLQEFRPHTGGCYLVGRIGTYKHGGSDQKIEIDWHVLSESEKNRLSAERAALQEKALRQKAEEAVLAAFDAHQIWQLAQIKGVSPYLQKRGLQSNEAESCKYLPNGTLVIPMIRYDLPKLEALKGVQRILPDGKKLYSKGCGLHKPLCAVRLGKIPEDTSIILVCEGFATALTIRLATRRNWVVFCAFDAGNLTQVVPMLHDLYPEHRLLICADDDWLTKDQHTGQLTNTGKNSAWQVAKQVENCDIVSPLFNRITRQAKDTDFDDLRQREGLKTVERQLNRILSAMERRYG